VGPFAPVYVNDGLTFDFDEWGGGSLRRRRITFGKRRTDCASLYSVVQFRLWRPSPMKSLSFTEFRKRASEILTLVEKSETVHVVRHGKTVAKIIPAEAEEKTPSWKQPGLRLVRPGASLSKAILEERRKSR
jgi:antitoxin (DNA-binding transcriptional repressor) of toxin-antitoxin stability system